MPPLGQVTSVIGDTHACIGSGLITTILLCSYQNTRPARRLCPPHHRQRPRSRGSLTLATRAPATATQDRRHCRQRRQERRTSRPLEGDSTNPLQVSKHAEQTSSLSVTFGVELIKHGRSGRNVPGVSLYFLTLSRLRAFVATSSTFRVAGTNTSGKAKLTPAGDLIVGSSARTGVGFVLMPFTLLKTLSEVCTTLGPPLSSRTDHPHTALHSPCYSPP